MNTTDVRGGGPTFWKWCVRFADAEEEVGDRCSNLTEERVFSCRGLVRIECVTDFWLSISSPTALLLFQILHIYYNIFLQKKTAMYITINLDRNIYYLWGVDPFYASPRIPSFTSRKIKKMGFPVLVTNCNLIT